MPEIVSKTMSTKTKQGSGVLDGGGAKVLADLLAEAIRNSGLSVESIANRAHMSRQYLYEMREGKANPTLHQLAMAFEATGTPLDRALNDLALYGRDKAFHDRVQGILNKKGSRAVALRVVVDGSSDGH